MTRKLVAALLILGSLGALAGPLLVAVVAVMFGASVAAATGPCMDPIGIVAPVDGPVRLPVVGEFRVTSDYGMRVNPGPLGHGRYVLHAGLDLAELPQPSTVVAAMAGIVRSVPTGAGGGHQIVIDHGGGVQTWYLHLSSRTVQVGDQVWAGRPIGVEGSSGNSTGPHLHFQVMVNGAPVNPRTWLTRHHVTVPALGQTGHSSAATPIASTASATPDLLGRFTLAPAPLAATATPGPAHPLTSGLPVTVGQWTGQQVINAAAIITAGQAMRLDARTITIGVMTAMRETSLQDLDRGDQVGPDSRGLFQQRSNGAWGSYADRMNPTVSATHFFAALITVPGYQQLPPTVAAHRVQRNADPYYYQPFWADAVAMVSTLTADPGLLERLPAAGTITGCPITPPPLDPPAGAGDGTGGSIVAAAQRYVGTPYSWAGGDIHGPTLGVYVSGSLDGSHTVGFDCSGLVLYAVYQATGISLAHSANAQGHDPRGHTIPRAWAQMRPGDVIAFSEDGTGHPGSFGHVGIYLGNGTMIDAPRPGKTVEIIQLKGSRYYEPMAWAIKRYGSTPAPLATASPLT